MKREKKTILRIFLIRSALVFVGWVLLYYGFILPNGYADHFLTDAVLKGTLAGLNLLGYETSSLQNVVLINGVQVVRVANGCNGLELYALYAGFIVCFPGKWLYKALFIPFGILLIYFINTIRVIALVLNYRFFEKTFEFNHKYTYVLIVYLFVFLLWRFWMNRFSVLAEKS